MTAENPGYNVLDAIMEANEDKDLAVNGFRQEPLGIGGKTGIELVEELTNAGININGGVRSRLLDPAFVTHPSPEEIMMVRGSVRDLGLNRPSTLARIQNGAANLGFGLCSMEAVVYQRLRDTKQPLRNVYWMITVDRRGYLNIFVLDCYENGLWLNGSWARPADRWDPESEFVFSLGK